MINARWYQDLEQDGTKACAINDETSSSSVEAWLLQDETRSLEQIINGSQNQNLEQIKPDHQWPGPP